MGGTSTPPQKLSRETKIKLLVDIVAATGIIVTLIVAIYQIGLIREFDRRRYTCEVAQRIQTAEHIQTFARIDALAKYILDNRQPDAKLWELLYPGNHSELTRQNMVRDDLNRILMVYCNASFLCKEGFAHRDILARSFGEDVSKFIRNVSIIGEWDPQIRATLPAMQRDLAPFLEPSLPPETDPI